MMDKDTARAQSATRPIYLDYQATTPLDPRVFEAMAPYLKEAFGNPHSVHHGFGWEAEEAVERARAQVAQLIGADPREIIFTSGATESNNLAIKGAAHFHRGSKRHIVTCMTEHKCVLESCHRVEAAGFRVTYLPVRENGLVDVERLAGSITDETLLVSIMAVNNEIGVIQPLAEIGALCRERGVLFHTDAAQAAGKIPLDVEDMRIDLMSISGHKMYGPKGIGALFVRRRPRVRLEPLIDGGGQERGLRSGTLPAPLCAGLGAACAIARDEMEAEAARLARLSARLYQGLVGRIEGVLLNGDRERRFPGNLNVAFAGVDGEELIRTIPRLAISSGSACTSASVEPSYVIRALGRSEAVARSSVRIGFGRFSADEEVGVALEMIVAAVERLRRRGRLVSEGRPAEPATAEKP